MKTEFTTFVFISMCTVTVPGERKDRSIPVEHSCNRLPYILKDTELQFCYSAGHLTDRNCAVTVTANAQDKVCVTFVQFYLDCYTDIILIDEAVPLQKNIYKCDSRHTSDFCSSQTSLEIIFQRKKNLQADSFGHVELRVYGIAESDSIPASTVTVLIVVGGLLGIVLLLVVSSFILSRILYHFHHKHRHQHEQHFSHEEAPLEPPPPYPGPDSEQQEMSTNSSQH